MASLLYLPDAIQDEEDLNKDAAERQDSAQDDIQEGTPQAGLPRDLTGNQVGVHWELNWLWEYQLSTLMNRKAAAATKSIKKQGNKGEGRRGARRERENGQKFQH